MLMQKEKKIAQEICIMKERIKKARIFRGQHKATENEREKTRKEKGRIIDLKTREQEASYSMLRWREVCRPCRALLYKKTTERKQPFTIPLREAYHLFRKLVQIPVIPSIR